MSDSKLFELQEIAKKALSSQSLFEKAMCLVEALRVCSKEAAQLKHLDPKVLEELELVNGQFGQAPLQTALLQRMSEGVLFVEPDGQITIANETLHRLLKKERGSLIGIHYWNAFEDGTFGFSMREALRYGMSYLPMYKSICDLGLELEISASYLCQQKPGLLILVRDLTEWLCLKSQLARAERMRELGEMAAKIAHDIRNPLGGIRGFASLLVRDLCQEPHLQEMAQQIIEGTKALETLVTHVLIFAKPLPLSIQTQNLTAFLRQIGKLIKSDPAFAPNVKLALNIPTEPVFAPFDANALQRALFHLLYNGLQAMTPKGGELSVGLIFTGSTCRISIGDTGVGIEETRQKNLFSVHFTTKQNGNGLGLAEVKKIVEGHAGSIEVQTARGQGTTFTIILPLKR